MQLHVVNRFVLQQSVKESRYEMSVMYTGLHNVILSTGRQELAVGIINICNCSTFLG